MSVVSTRHFNRVKRILRAVPRRWRSAECSTDLKQILLEKIKEHRETIGAFRKEYGKTKISEVTVNQLYGGMRGVKGLLCETSVLDPNEGIRFRGLTIPDCQEQLPKAPCGKQPLPEGLFWLLLTGDVPNNEQVAALSKEWAERSDLPCHAIDFLDGLPKHVHPMSQLAAACTICNTESLFVKAYSTGTKKGNLWEAVYEDSMNLIAKIPVIAAKIYRNTFKDRSDVGPVDTAKDWSYNFCKMLGYDNEQFMELMRLYLTIHSDHEGGNVSAHTTHLVHSTFSDPYLAYASGMNGLAGPLHGLANQEVLTFLLKVQKEMAGSITEDKLKDFINKTLKSGKVIPGYGHAVLRKTDPRYLCQNEFAKEYIKDDELCKIVDGLYKTVPPILKALGKVQNPWPNVDAHSGVLLYHYGMKEMEYYTVLFAVSRALGVLSSIVWHRALGLPLERPKSISSEKLMEEVKSVNKNELTNDVCVK